MHLVCLFYIITVQWISILQLRQRNAKIHTNRKYQNVQIHLNPMIKPWNNIEMLNKNYIMCESSKNIIKLMSIIQPRHKYQLIDFIENPHRKLKYSKNFNSIIMDCKFFLKLIIDICQLRFHGIS